MEVVGVRLVEILETVADGFFAIDREWRYTYVNRRAEEFVKRSRDELLGRTVWEMFPALVGSTWEREYRRAMAHQVAVHFEEYYPPLDAWFETHAYPSPAGLTIYITDVTTRRRAEQDLAVRLGQQAAVVAVGLHALSAADVSTLLDEAARAVASGLGVEMTKILELSEDGRSLQVRASVGLRAGPTPPVVGADLDSQAGYTLASRSPVIVEDLRTETRFRGPSLLVDHGVVSGMSVVIDGPAGRPFGVLGAHTRKFRRFTTDDVHFLQAIANVVAQTVQRRSMMDKLMESESRFRLLAETVHDAFFIADLETMQNEYVSPAFEAIWGQPYDALGSRWLETVHPEDRSRLVRQVERACPGSSNEYRIFRPDGSLRWICFQVFPVRAAGASSGRVIGVATDVTDRRASEEIAHRLQDERLARATAEAGLRARDDVLALVSHDLRSPLGTILMGADLLAQTTEDSSAIRRLRIIERAALRMSRLVEDLVDVARLEAGKMTLRLEPLDVAAVVAEVREALEPQALERSARMESDIPSAIPRVRGDRDRIVRVILNLVGNAIRFTPPNGVVTVRAESSGDSVVVSVSDRGPGIPEQERPHLFRPFWQGRGSDQRGAGLGLSIARGIVEAHRGRIWVTDTPGGGATLSFSLPVAFGQPEAAPAEGTSTVVSS